jgi:molybdate transport system substrate-binding protein
MRLIFLALLGISLFADIKIAASANVSYVLDEIVKKFNQNYPDIKIQIAIASSGKLAAQIENGAKYDIFLSANVEYPKRLFNKGLTYTKPVIYAKGKLVLGSVKELRSLEDILKAKKIAIANPKTAPYGIAAVEFLKNRGIYDKIEDRLIFGESVAQTVVYTLKASDMGVIAKSALYNKKGFKLNYIDIPKELYKPINQAMVLIKSGDEAMNFFIFLLSKEAVKIFKKYGYD